MITAQTADRLHKTILLAMEDETRRIVEDEAKTAAARVEERVRAMAGQIAMKIASYVTYYPGEREVRIVVRLPDRDLPT